MRPNGLQVHRLATWLLLVSLPLKSQEAVAFSLRAKETRSNMTLNELQNMEYEAHSVQGARVTFGSHGSQAGHLTHAKSWNHFQKRHHRRHGKKLAQDKKKQHSKPMQEEMEHDDPTHCDPPCTKHGVCNDNRCFCKTPWTGTTCQHQIKVEKRIAYTLVFGIIGVAFVMGTIVATLLFNYQQKAVKEFANYGDRTTRRETWKPSEAESKGKKKGKS